MSDPSSRHWLKRAQQGDRDAASRLLEAHYARIFGYLRRLSGNDEDAADLTQEAFRRVWRSLEQYDGRAAVSTWMHRIAYCVWVDGMRRRRPDCVRPSEAWWDALPDEVPGPQSAAETAELVSALWRRVEALPDRQRQAILLHHAQRLSLKETASVLGVPLSTLKQRLRAGLDRLRADFREPLAPAPNASKS